MPRTDLPVDIPSPLHSSQSSEDTNSETDVDSSLLKSSDKCPSYGSIETNHTYSILKEECDLLPLPITLQAKNRFAALSKADLLFYQYDPFWTRLRTGMLAFFWLLLLVLIVAAGVTAALDTRACSFAPPD